MNKAFTNHVNQLYGNWLLGRDSAFTESISQYDTSVSLVCHRMAAHFARSDCASI